jgi:hypothetical protein
MTKKLGKQREDDIIDESKWEIVYTDGACQRNGKIGAIAGIGVWWSPDDPRQVEDSEHLSQVIINFALPQGTWPKGVPETRQTIGLN